MMISLVIAVNHGKRKWIRCGWWRWRSLEHHLAADFDFHWFLDRRYLRWTLHPPAAVRRLPRSAQRE